jgi:hypothetical protein
VNEHRNKVYVCVKQQGNEVSKSELISTDPCWVRGGKGILDDLATWYTYLILQVCFDPKRKMSFWDEEWFKGRIYLFWSKKKNVRHYGYHILQNIKNKLFK